jgi:adenine phosphoribosyltransferase
VFETLISHFIHHIASSTVSRSTSGKIDVVVGLDARGFLLGPIIALRLGAAFVPVRKKGKLPGQCVTATYEKEYGVVSAKFAMLRLGRLTPSSLHRQDAFEMQADAIKPGQNVIVVDDLIATGKHILSLDYFSHSQTIWRRWFCKGGRRTHFQAGR